MARLMKIRIAQEKDLPVLTEIYNEAILKTAATFDTEIKTIEQRRDWFVSHHKLPIWVCERDGKVIGWASLSAWSDRCAYSGTIENSVYIFEKFQGQGAGKLLMDQLILFARENKFKTIIARISDGNLPSIHLHRRYGFESIGVMKSVGFKFDRWIDVHMMQLML